MPSFGHQAWMSALASLSLISPDNGAPLALAAEKLTGGGADYPIIDGIALLMSDEVRQLYRASTDTVQEYYRKVADSYGTSHHVAMPGARAFLSQLAAKLVPYVRPGARVLEIGSGTGFATEVLLQIGARPVIADASLEMLRLNHERHAELAAVCCATERLPFADASFDTVFGNNTFYLVPDMERAAAEIARVLAPGGVLVLSEMNPHHPLWPVMFTLKRRWFESSFYRLFPSLMRRRFGAHGMQIEECDFYTYTPYFASQRLLAALGGFESIVGWSRLLRRFSAIRIFYAIRKP